ncbi:MAG: YerC/YecD family TrpR-related protein [Patescibacteria group bacterium]
MPRKRPETIEEIERKRILNQFWTMVSLLGTKEEAKNFFKDLLSETEALMLARRIEIARLLLQNWSYEEIKKELSTAAATIASVHRWLEGGFGGYQKEMKKMEQVVYEEEAEALKKIEANHPFTGIEWMKRKYPFHFLLVSLLQFGIKEDKKKKSPTPTPKPKR